MHVLILCSSETPRTPRSPPPLTRAQPNRALQHAPRGVSRASVRDDVDPDGTRRFDVVGMMSANDSDAASSRRSSPVPSASEDAKLSTPQPRFPKHSKRVREDLEGFSSSPGDKSAHSVKRAKIEALRKQADCCFPKEGASSRATTATATDHEGREAGGSLTPRAPTSSSNNDSVEQSTTEEPDASDEDIYDNDEDQPSHSRAGSSAKDFSNCNGGKPI